MTRERAGSIVDRSRAALDYPGLAPVVMPVVMPVVIPVVIAGPIGHEGCCRERVPRWLLISVALAGGTAEVGASDQDLGTFKDWRAHTFVEEKAKVCSMWSQPEKAEGNYKRRGEIFAFVTHRPAERRNDRVSFEMGYDFKPGKTLTVQIDKQRFELETSGSTAWSGAVEVNDRLIKLMRAGSRMVVKGVSKRGTDTTDTYSLSGFTAAHRAIGKACKKPVAAPPRRAAP